MPPPLRSLLRWFVFSFAWVVTAAAEQPLRIGVEVSAEPLSFLDARGQPTGFSTDLVHAMATRGNLAVEIVPDYWTVLLREFNAGRIDVLADVNVTEERQASMDFSISHAYLHGVVYHRPDHAPIQRVADLAGLKLAVLKGSVTEYTAAAHGGWGTVVTTFPTAPKALEAVQSGQCDAALLMLPIRRGTDDHGLAKQFLTDIIFQYYFAVHKGDAATLARLNEALAAVRQNGEFDRLWGKWIGPIEPHPIRLADLQPYIMPLTLVLMGLLALFGWQRHMLARVSAHARALEESEARFRTTFEGAGIGMALVDPAGRLMKTNSMFQEMMGYSEAECARLTFMAVTYPEDLETDLALYRELVAGRRESYQVVKRYVRKDRLVVWGRLTVSVVKGPDGRMQYTVGMVEDITAHKQVESSLLVTQQRLHAILDHSPAQIFVKGLDGRFLLANRPFDEKYRGDWQSVLGLTVSDIFPKGEAILHEKQDRRVAETGAPVTEEIAGEEAGVRRCYLSVKFPLRDASGAIYAIGGINTDMTEYQQLQAQLLQAQKMEAFGQLAGGIAHDFNNILAVFQIQLALLTGEPATPAATIEKLNGLLAMTQKAARLTRQLLMFSRQEAVKMQPMDLTQTLEETFKMLRRVLGEHIDIRLDRRGPHFWVNADAGMMEQVVMNLAVNARDAMPHGGKLLVQTETVEIAAAGATGNRRAGRFVCLSVTDTGHGMDRATLKRIFEPFFTTKQVGRGTGLGLASVYGILKQHGGWIEAESDVGQGSTFRAYLPAVDPPGPAGLDLNAPEIPGGSERILLVEDDEAVREVADVCLRQKGYDVVVAPNAIEALKLWREHDQRFDLLVTDVVMPGGIGGLQLAMALKEVQATLKVIFISGYSQAAKDSQSTFGRLGTYVSKPFDHITLLTIVRRVLDEQRCSEPGPALVPESDWASFS